MRLEKGVSVGVFDDAASEVFAALWAHPESSPKCCWFVFSGEVKSTVGYFLFISDSLLVCCAVEVQ